MTQEQVVYGQDVVQYSLGVTDTIFRFVDDDGDERLSLTNPDGWFFSRGLNLGKAGIERVYLSQPPYGTIMATSYRGPVTMQIPLLLCPNARDNQSITPMVLMALMNALSVELDRDRNILEYRPTGLVTSYFMDTYRSELPTLWRGEGVPNPMLLRQGGTPLIIEMDRDPLMRGAGMNI